MIIWIRLIIQIKFNSSTLSLKLRMYISRVMYWFREKSVSYKTRLKIKQSFSFIKKSKTKNYNSTKKPKNQKLLIFIFGFSRVVLEKFYLKDWLMYGTAGLVNKFAKRNVLESVELRLVLVGHHLERLSMTSSLLRSWYLNNFASGYLNNLWTILAN